MEKSENISKATSTVATTEQWRELYETAAMLKSMAPWCLLWDTDVITIKLPGRTEPVFCSVMGQGGACYGIGVYADFDAFARLHRLMSGDEQNPTGTDSFEQKCLVCYYGDREEIEPQDRAVIQKLGLKFRGRNQWIYFRTMEPGYVPWFLNAEQVLLLTDVLKNLALAYSQLARGDISVDFEGGETLLRLYAEEQNEWVNAAVPMPPVSVLRPALRLTDELLIAHLKKQKKLNVRLELDSFYIPTPVQEQKDEAPYFPLLTVLADGDQGALIDQHMAQPGESFEDMIFDIFIAFIEDHGRPTSLYVRDDRIACVLAETCTEIDISLVVGQAMPTVDEFYNGLQNFMR